MSKLHPPSVLFDYGQAFTGAWATRFAELVNEQGRTLLQAANCKVDPLCVSALLQIEKSGQITLAELARHMGLSHQLTKQRTTKLEKAGFIAVAPDPTDGRKKMLALTAEGTSEATKLITVTTAAGEAFSDLADELGCALMPKLHAAIVALEQKPLSDRSK